ncbi:hypothetical protein ACFO6R_16095 [Eubacterium multiforme]|uniref:Uncharacterized protein n=1 Tax=Eubacterium multiforme TaxID=83339 RepID=A0ABT9UTG7_9FIRM|nr:hypothetical protein [Eubacterium multiforme]MDQ0149616.1 hypothetical protein [Eubacterium multiforme]
MRENKMYFILEGTIIGITIIFIIKLLLYNKILNSIQNGYSNELEKAIEVAKEPNYFNYLLAGGGIILILFSYTIFILRKTFIDKKFIFALINIILGIWLLVVFWNPILTTFAILLFLGGTLVSSD